MRIALIILFFTLWSCKTGVTPQKQLNCLVQEPVWEVKKWEGSALDTNSNVEDGIPYHKISNIIELNSPNNEYHLAHISKNNTLLTFGGEDYKKQFVREALIVESDFLSPKKKVDFVDEIPFGFISKFNDEVFFATIPSYLTESKIQFYADKNSGFGRLRVPTDKMIGRSRIYTGNMVGSKLVDSEITNISWGLTDYDWESHPAITPDGKYLFFASTRKGGIGGIDIWYSKRGKNGKWSKPINPGSSINTPLDEVSPFIAPDKKNIYFASNGRESVGGFDIHKAEISDEFWENPRPKYLNNAKNIGKPINTSSNELFPNFDQNFNIRFYYASDQNGGKGNFDIWVYQKVTDDGLELANNNNEVNFNKEIDVDVEVEPKQLENNIQAPEMKNNDTELGSTITQNKEVRNEGKIGEYPKEFVVSGKVVSNQDKPIKNADITLRELPEGIIQNQTKTDNDGNYELMAKKGKELQIIAESENYFYDTYIIPESIQDTLTQFSRNLNLNLELTVRINFPYNVYNAPYKYVLDKNGNETKQEWQNELDEIANNIKRSSDALEKVILVGHTDLQGSHKYNNELGLNRVKFVTNELKKRGVSEQLLEIRTAGKKEPLPRLENESDDEYYKRLRRVTLEKIFKGK